MLSLAAREADIVGINANLKTGKADDPDTAPSMNPANTDEKLGWVRDAAGDALRRHRDPGASPGSSTSPTTRVGLAEAMAPAFDTTPDEVLESPGRSRRDGRRR